MLCNWGEIILFSIIVPVYNAEPFIKRCVDSIYKQQINDIDDVEIILIDDQSTDKSWSVICEMAEVHSEIKCKQIPHGGAGAARNAGLKLATGDYILFMDADDYWIDEHLLEKLKEMINYNHTDVFMYQMVKATENGTILKRYKKRPFIHENAVLSLNDVYTDLVADGQALASACNKCVRRELLNKYSIEFIEDLCGEDIDWTLQLFSYAQTICLLNLDAYAYTQHKTESRSTASDAVNDLVIIVSKWAEKLKKGIISHASAVAGLVAFEYAICMGNIAKLSQDKKTIMLKYRYLLKYGLDQKTKLIYHFYKIFGFNITCQSIRFYLFTRSIW